MKAGTKIAIAGVAAAIVVVLGYRMLKAKAYATSSGEVSENGLAPKNKKIDVGGIGKKVTGLLNVNANKADRFADIPVVNKADRFVDVPVVNKADRFSSAPVVNKADRF